MSKNTEKKPVGKSEPSIVILTVTLFGICAVCALLLGLTNMVTRPIIEQNIENKKAAAIAAEVLPGFSGTLTEMYYVGTDKTIKSVLQGSDGSYVVEVSPKTSYSGNLTLLVGIGADGTIAGLSATQSGESEGIGSRALEPEYFQAQYVGKTGPVELSKNGGQVEGITGASFTSTGVKEAVNSAYEALDNLSADASQVPVPAGPTISENILFMDTDGDGYVAIVDCAPDSFSKTALTIEVRMDGNKVVTGVTVLESDESPGLGARASEPEFIDQFIGVSSEVSATTQENPDGNIQSIAGASMTSKAICNGVNAVLEAVDYPDQWPTDPVVLPAESEESEEPEQMESPSVTMDGDDYVVLVDCGEDSFSKTLTIEVRLDADKVVKGVTIVETGESPGLGARASEPEFINQFIGVSAEVSAITGENPDGNIQSIAGASMTSKAICNGVNAALQAVNSQG